MTAVELEKLRLQKREARRLLKTLVYLPRKPTETLSADRNEIETIAFTWLTLRLLGHNVEIDTLIESAEGTLENPRTDLEYSVKRAVRSTRIQGWSRGFANLLQELAR